VKSEIDISNRWEGTEKRALFFLIAFLGCVAALYFSGPVDAQTSTSIELWSVILILAFGLISLLKAIEYIAKSIWVMIGF
jgi:hypothetical protein